MRCFRSLGNLIMDINLTYGDLLNTERFDLLYFCLFKYTISCLTSEYVYIVKIQIKNVTDTSSQSWRFPGLAILSVAKTVIEKALEVVHYQKKFQITINILAFSSSLWMNMLFTSISRPFLSLHSAWGMCVSTVHHHTMLSPVEKRC